MEAASAAVAAVAAVAAIFHHHQETSNHKMEVVAAVSDNSHHQVNMVHQHKAAALEVVSVKDLAPVPAAIHQVVDQVAKVSNFEEKTIVLKFETKTANSNRL